MCDVSVRLLVATRAASLNQSHLEDLHQSGLEFDQVKIQYVNELTFLKMKFFSDENNPKHIHS